MTGAITKESLPEERRAAEAAEDHLPLVRMLARRFAPLQREREELYQQGCVGLMKAVNRFDPSMGLKFSTYAVPLILGEMRALTRLDAPCHVPRRDREMKSRIRRAESLLRQELHREPTITELSQVLRVEPAELTLMMEEVSAVSLDAPVNDSPHALVDLIPDPGGEDWVNHLMLKDLLDRLPLRERKLLYLRFRMGRTQAEAAQALGMTQVQVSRLEMKLRVQLRQEWIG